jgi:hypothetical protein
MFQQFLHHYIWLEERMKNSKNMLLIISDDTNYDRGMLNFEIEKAVDYYKIPIIIAYPGYSYILEPSAIEQKWPKALKERINSQTAKCIHVPFRGKCISDAISQFSVNNKVNQLTSPLSYYGKDTYKRWGYIV